MPLPPSPRALPWGPRRRSLLASAAGAALLAGCSAGPDDPAAADRGPSPAERARARAARDSAGLARRYDAVIAAHPALAPRLGPLRAEVLRHAAAFGGGAAASPSASASASASASGTPTATGSPAAPAGPTATDGTVTTSGAVATGGATASGGAGSPGAGKPSGGATGGPSDAASPAVPVKPADALASLAAAERSLADARAAALLDVPGELARLLASVAAAGAAHAYLLTEGDR
ncbi:hypothetical protein [Streptomyces sennicomposti]|uniref:hypothetical protein n=1 Tax=Streptomyces sennicomposti TaxID=2873384 RepID=UPI001CA782B3|nr:hypothetical protein [Streptomyces sennicomposti]MBY8869839.1 hypothetical protein [Streptomyces sennicomposti]